MKTKDHNGKPFSTSAIKTLKAKGIKYVDFSGREFESISQMAKAWGISHLMPFFIDCIWGGVLHKPLLYHLLNVNKGDI